MKIGTSSIDRDKFEEACSYVMKYLAEFHHPHMSVLITSISADLLEDHYGYRTEIYLVD